MQEISQWAKKALSRIRNILSRGILTNVTQSKTPTAKVQLLDDEIYDGIEFAQDFGFISYPPIDGTTEIISAFIGGVREHGTILKAFNKTKSFKVVNPNVTLASGDVVLYNTITDTYIYLKADGTIKIKSATSITLDAPSVVITGNLTVDGDILDNATGAHINTNKVRDMRTIYNTHTHGGVAAGGANTAVPNQLE